jgi:hypothetical protein
VFDRGRAGVLLQLDDQPVGVERQHESRLVVLACPLDVQDGAVAGQAGVTQVQPGVAVQRLAQRLEDLRARATARARPVAVPAHVGGEHHPERREVARAQHLADDLDGRRARVCGRAVLGHARALIPGC